MILDRLLTDGRATSWSRFMSSLVFKIHHLVSGTPSLTESFQNAFMFQGESLRDVTSPAGCVRGVSQRSTSSFKNMLTGRVLILRHSVPPSLLPRLSHRCLSAPPPCFPSRCRSHNYAARLAYLASPLLVLAELLQVASGRPA